MAHCVREGFDQPVNDAQRPSWAAHQVASTVNFAGANRLLGWYVGGLNFQIEHHLFPGVSHVHYQKLAPLVASVCREYGVRYTSRATLWQAIQAHHRWLRHLGQPESAPPS
jgi:linoleoyl-CoA desaturase